MTLPSKCTFCKASIVKQKVVTKHVYGKNNASFFECDYCRIIYQYPLISKNEEKKFYREEFESFMNSRVGSKGSWENIELHQKDNQDNLKRRMSYLRPYLKTKKKILEVGCSSGFMLLKLNQLGHTCDGVEPSGLFYEYLKQKNINVFKDLKEVKKKKYDLIIHFFVLEHIRDPIKFLKEQRKLLNKNGKIIFEIPCSQDALYKVYDIPEFERFYWSVAHPWYFNMSSLEFLLKKINKKFKIIKDQRYDLSNHLYWMKNGKPGGMNYYTNLLGRDIEEKYKKNLISRGYFDTLVGIVIN